MNINQLNKFFLNYFQLKSTVNYLIFRLGCFADNHFNFYEKKFNLTQLFAVPTDSCYFVCVYFSGKSSNKF